jgi:hypothetical protein
MLDRRGFTAGVATPRETTVIRFRLKCFVRSLIATGIVATGLSPHADAAAPNRLRICPPLAARLTFSKLQHRSFSLYTDRFNRRHPVATDGTYVLVGWEYSREPVFGGPVQLWTVRLPSTRLVPVPRGAYPRRTFLGQWQIDWPWIAGIAYTTPLPAFPADWRLWAGNLVTGRRVILDSYRAHRHPVAEFFPRFALNGGRVVWEYSVDRPVRFDRFSSQGIAIEDLTTRRRELLTPPDPEAVLGRITSSESRIVWEEQTVSTTKKSLAVDLWLYDLRSHRLTRLSRNTTSASSSLYPRLAGRYLLFEQGPNGSDYGVPYLVDLTVKTGAASRQWWRAYRFRQLGRDGLTNTQMGDGLVSWEDWRLLDVTRSKVWPERYWTVDAIAGRTVLVDHMNMETGHETYAAWQIPSACAASGFR